MSRRPFYHKSLVGTIEEKFTLPTYLQHDATLLSAEQILSDIRQGTVSPPEPKGCGIANFTTKGR